MENNEVTYQQFAELDIRTGTIVKAENFEKARNPAYKLWIDFGELGIKKSSAQITDLYDLKALIDKRIIAVVNFPKKQIADFMSECLVLGALSADGVVLLQTDQSVPNGLMIA